MMISPVHLSSSLGLAWAYAGQQAAALAGWLGLGPLGIRAFLLRAVCQKEDADLKRLETLVRRILFLVAMETPLPEFRQAPPRDLSGKRPPAAPPVQIVFPLPAFRLTEVSPSPVLKGSRLAARNRRLAEPQDPAHRPGPHDMLPAMGLMNRFAALEDALADPEAQVSCFRRKLARIRADKALPLPVADTPPAACTGPQNTPVLRELFWTLHDAALSRLPVRDSS
jgi:hypothetical protein